MRPSDRYTYENAGFNSMMNRSKKSILGGSTINGSSRGSGRALNFDLQQVEGSLGDNLRVGHINLKGAQSQIDLESPESGDVVIRLGELDV